MLISQASRFSELQSRIHGRVLTEGDEAWDASRQTFNLTHDQRPAALVRPANADDVVETVRYASQRGLRIAPQSTGHNAGPIEDLEDSLLVRTDSLQEVRIDVAARRARVGSGVRWGAVADPASEAGLAPLSGSSRDVGVTGYSLGGGLGWLGRKHGLQANAVTAVEIVTADGELRRIDHDNETDLFWAVRGGGGNYGVVTALEFDLFPAPEIYAGALFFPYERGSRGHARLARARVGRPAGRADDLGEAAALPADLEDIPEPFRGQAFAVIQTAYLGSEAEGAELVRPLTDLGPGMNTFAMVEPGALGYLAMDPEDPVPYASRGRIVSNVSAAGIDALVEATVDGPALVMTELRALGGALARRAPGAGVRATLDGDYLMFALGAVFTPEAYDEVHSQAQRVDDATGALGRRHPLRQLRGGQHGRPAVLRRGQLAARCARSGREWDPNGLFLANHEIKDS